MRISTLYGTDTADTNTGMPDITDTAYTWFVGRATDPPIVSSSGNKLKFPSPAILSNENARYEKSLLELTAAASEGKMSLGCSTCSHHQPQQR